MCPFPRALGEGEGKEVEGAHEGAVQGALRAEGDEKASSFPA